MKHKSFWQSLFRDDMCKGKFLKDYSTNHIKPFYRSKERY